VNRRVFLGSAAVAAFAPTLPGWLSDALAQDRSLTLGEPKAFSFDALIEEARSRAARDYVEPIRPAPDIISRIGYAEHGALRFKPDYALFAEGGGVYPVTFFHLGRFFPKGVRMKVVDGGEAREIMYSADYFEMPEDSVARKLPRDIGFAGFRFQESRVRDDWRTQDWVAFLGASYFRSIGALNQYGISARGVAVDTAEPGGEEFPDFVEFYIQGAKTEGEASRVYALLDGPRVTGAFAFEIWRTSGSVMHVDTRLFTRAPISRLGIAPLTSMFWYGKHNRPYKVDWRPQVHDSDGLEIWTGSGERIWRALNNPRHVVVSSFVDRNPRGFGLMQRDRNVENYLDGVNYDLRPSLWVEPLHDWGEGTVQLVEIPTDDEIHDNIVTFWVPNDPVTGGEALQFRYRLHWLADNPYPGDLSRAVATRLGRGGKPGLERPVGVTKFVVEFAGGPLDGLTDRAVPDADISASRGEISLDFVERVPRTGRWRVTFDLTVGDAEKPVELRMFLRQGERPLSETWTFQYWPGTAL
jgi:periplasmic glucans biosynthesis protein